MTTAELRMAIGRCEAGGHTGATLLIGPPVPLAHEGQIELAPLVYGREVSRFETGVIVHVDLPSLRRLLSLAEIGDGPPQGSV